MVETHHIPMSLRAAYLSMHRQTNAHLAQFGITADQFVCLILLADKDGITQQELVQQATSDPNTIRAMLVLLEKRGLVIRQKHPTDGRARSVTITDKGRQVLDQLAIAVEPVHERLCTRFHAEEVETLRALLQRISEAMAK
jgi:DNA-binding MarR family transcriptional regulator